MILHSYSFLYTFLDRLLSPQYLSNRMNQGPCLTNYSLLSVHCMSVYKRRNPESDERYCCHTQDQQEDSTGALKLTLPAISDYSLAEIMLQLASYILRENTWTFSNFQLRTASVTLRPGYFRQQRTLLTIQIASAIIQQRPIG